MLRDWIRAIRQTKYVYDLEQYVAQLNADIADLEAQKVSLVKDTDTVMTELNAINASIGKGRIMQNAIETMEEYGIPYYDDSIDMLEHRRFNLQMEVASCCNNGLWRIESKYTLNGSEIKGEEMQRAFGNGMVYAFNAYFDKKEKTVTLANLNKSKEQIKAKFNAFQKKANKLGIALNSKYVRARLDMIDVNLAIKVKEKEERQRIREEKRRLKEQEQLLVDAEREKARLQQERRMYEQSLTKALTEQERMEFEAQLKVIDKRVADIDYRVNNAKAGYLYIAATPAMPNCCKLGCTRRLNPLKRIAELSSASVPYPFVCYGLVFSDDVFELERRIHEYFDTQRTNKENRHKEFFNITPGQAIAVLKNIMGVEVHFVNNENEKEDDED
nr:MAG TPA: hypothetical protein [Caudoviricetes sp.]